MLTLTYLISITCSFGKIPVVVKPSFYPAAAKKCPGVILQMPFANCLRLRSLSP
jgi:hypothetical protein